MSRDTIPVAEKKSKKSKSKDKEQSAEKPLQVMEVNEGVDGEADKEDKRKKKKERREKKKKNNSSEKKKKKDRMSKSDGVETEENNAVVDKDAMDLDAEEPVHNKKRKHASLVDETGNMAVDAEPHLESNEKERKKKQKRDAEETGSTPSESKKDKKKKRKEQKEKEQSKDKGSEVASQKVSSTAPSEPNASASTSASSSVTPTASNGEIEAFLEKHSVTISTPREITPATPILSFNELPIQDDLKKSFFGFKEPTPIQACTWPPALAGQDVVGIAETGSGKTLAFGIPALSHLISTSVSIKKSNSGSPTVSVLVVAPTRELAIQTHDTLSALGKPFGIASVAVFGGVPKEAQVKMLRNASKTKDGLTTRIVVGTPGRILDLMQEGACDLSGVNYLVLDEADRMLDKGFENDIRRIIEATKPKEKRQTMMFSATWPEAVRRLASTFQNNPVRVTVGSDDLTANSRVEQLVEVFDDARSKDQRLISALKTLNHKKRPSGVVDEQRVLVFALYKKEAARVEQMLSYQGYSVCALHGDMSQNARMEMLEKFKNGSTGLMVATDVAARGLDIPNVGAVINYTFPLTIEDYIHRIGRTGRGGKTGKSITFFTGEQHERALAGEFARVLREGGFDNEALRKKFPMTIKKKEHGAYGAFFRDDIPVPTGPTKIVF